jgi:hypothetical protein
MADIKHLILLFVVGLFLIAVVLLAVNITIDHGIDQRNYDTRFQLLTESNAVELEVGKQFTIDDVTYGKILDASTITYRKNTSKEWKPYLHVAITVENPENDKPKFYLADVEQAPTMMVPFAIKNKVVRVVY